MNLFFVFLRRPYESDDRRNDPFWEFGSFGVTGCHSKNLLNPSAQNLIVGDRLVFLQGGNGEIRVVGVTPNIAEIKVWQPIGYDRKLLEVRWDSSYRSLPYEEAPLLVSNHHSPTGQFPAVNSILASVNRSTLVAKAASKFRTSIQPLPEPLAKEILTWFDRPGLPKTARYIDSVAPSWSSWHKNAVDQQWWLLEERMQRYCDCLGVTPDILFEDFGKSKIDVPKVTKKSCRC